MSISGIEPGTNTLPPTPRAVERMMDFDRGPGKILKYDLKSGKFRSLGPPFEVWAPVKITASPLLSTALPTPSKSHEKLLSTYLYLFQHNT